MAWSKNTSGKLGYHISTFHGQKSDRTLHTNFNKVINILSIIRTNFSAIFYCWNSIYCSCLPTPPPLSYIQDACIIPNLDGHQWEVDCRQQCGLVQGLGLLKFQYTLYRYAQESLPFYAFWHQSIFCYSPRLFSICERKTSDQWNILNHRQPKLMMQGVIFCLSFYYFYATFSKTWHTRHVHVYYYTRSGNP